MYILSFDVATKSLAVSLIKYNYNINDAYAQIKKIYEEYKKENKPTIDKLKSYNLLLDKTNDILHNMISFEMAEVIDLIPDKQIKDTTINERTIRLKNYLIELDKKLSLITGDLTILIEYQMGPNDKSRVISSQLLYHFSVNYTKILLIGPSLKNKVFIKNDEKSEHSYYLQKHKTNYTANKNHSKYVMQKILNIYKSSRLIKKIPISNYDDIGDSILMSVAYAIKYDLF